MLFLWNFNEFWHFFKKILILHTHWAGVRPTIGAMVLHWQGKILAKCNSFSSSSRVHSVFLILGSSHSYQRALHCLADFRTKREDIRDHWFNPYFITAAFRISSSEFFQTPPWKGLGRKGEKGNTFDYISHVWFLTIFYYNSFFFIWKLNSNIFREILEFLMGKNIKIKKFSQKEN